jgi:hypothetical protein
MAQISIAEVASLSYERRCALAESCLRTLVAEAGDFVDLEVPATTAAFAAVMRDSFGTEPTERALRALKARRVVH